MLAIIDGDVLAYQSCRSRHNRDNSPIQLDSNGQKIPIKYTAAEDAKYLRECWDSFKRELNKLIEKLYCSDYIMAVKGHGCYRKLLYPDYKANRHDKPQSTPQNEFVPVLRKLAIHEGYAIPANDCEADDLIRIWAEEARRAGQDHIICSIDKDLRCIPGRHYVMHYDSEKQKILSISEDEARRHYYQQLLKGDPTDNIPGVPRVGPVKAEQMITACSTEQEMQETVVEQYLIAYGPDDWYSHFLINAKLIHLQTTHFDYFDCSHWPIIQELCA
jgi:5'-3' exonuclease